MNQTPITIVNHPWLYQVFWTFIWLSLWLSKVWNKPQCFINIHVNFGLKETTTNSMHDLLYSLDLQFLKTFSQFLKTLITDFKVLLLLVVPGCWTGLLEVAGSSTSTSDNPHLRCQQLLLKSWVSHSQNFSNSWKLLKSSKIYVF